MNTLSKIIFTTALALVLSGCSSERAGSTSSKIKIIGANAFSGSLGTAANNGLLLYGRSLDGKSFTKKINSDVLDLNFPNGTWNFYAVAWEHGAPTIDTGLMGKVSCAKALGIQLKGVEVAINLKLNNNNCDGNFHPNAEFVATENKLGSLSLFSCKNFSAIASYASTNNTSCDQTVGFPNKGYATSFKLIVPEYSSFGGPGGPAITSACMEVQSSVATANLSTPGFTIASALNFPRIGLNGFDAFIKVYYSATPCDESLGFSTISLSQSSKKKHFTSTPTAGVQIKDQYFLETDAAVICQGPRLASLFASGKGTTDLPYTICNKEQLDNINVDFNDAVIMARNKSFDLISNINFGFNYVTPIGDGFNAYTGTFNGWTKRLENFRIQCNPSVNEDYIGLFRFASGAKFSNLILNKGVIECDSSTKTNNYVGLLLGKGISTVFKNISAFGHISGDAHVGGVAGYFNGNSSLEDVHFEGGVSAEANIGGLVGTMNSVTGIVFNKSSFSGVLESNCSGGGPFCESNIGGLIGEISGSAITIKESIVKLKKLKGSKILGGIAGKTDQVGIFNTIVSGFMTSKAKTDGSSHKVQMGGLIGYANSGILHGNIITVLRESAKDIGDSTLGSVVGNKLSTPSCSIGAPNRNYATGNSGYSGTTCNVNSFASYSDIVNPSYYGSPFDLTTGLNANYPAFKWIGHDQYNDIPRLLWESDREATVPYLRRECTGLYLSQSGTGTRENPITICNDTQFNLMNTNTHYILKKHIHFDGATLIPKPAGTYFLDGNGFYLADFDLDFTSGNSFGLFRELSPGSEIQNLGIVLGKIDIINYMVTQNTSVGLLAGKNFGLIKNVTVKESDLKFHRPNFLTDITPHFLRVGGLVAINGLGGKIYNSDLEVEVKLYQPLLTSDYIYAASVAAENLGEIRVVKSNGKVSRIMGKVNNSTVPLNLGVNPVSCWGYENNYVYNADESSYLFCNTTTTTWEPVYKATGNEILAGLVAINSNILSELNFDGSIEIMDDISNISSVIAPSIGVNSSGAGIFDLDISGSYDFTNIGQLSRHIHTNSGTVSRTYFHPQGSIVFDFVSEAVVGGSANNTICHKDPTTNCTNSAILFSLTDPILELDSNNYFWDIGIDYLNRDDKTWLFREGKISLLRTRGNFEKLGKGF